MIMKRQSTTSAEPALMAHGSDTLQQAGRANGAQSKRGEEQQWVSECVNA